MTITDEMVELAQNTWRFAKKEHMRAAIEAVAPLLVAQGMREAADICFEIDLDCRNAILACAQELDPK